MTEGSLNYNFNLTCFALNMCQKFQVVLRKWKSFSDPADTK